MPRFAEQDGVGASLGSPAGGAAADGGSWFDRLTTSGQYPLALSLSKGELTVLQSTAHGSTSSP